MRQGEKYAFIGGKERKIDRKYDESVLEGKHGK